MTAMIIEEFSADTPSETVLFVQLHCSLVKSLYTRISPLLCCLLHQINDCAYSQSSSSCSGAVVGTGADGWVVVGTDGAEVAAGEEVPGAGLVDDGRLGDDPTEPPAL
jgi:hypothetical protein